MGGDGVGWGYKRHTIDSSTVVEKHYISRITTQRPHATTGAHAQTDMDGIEARAAIPHISDQQVFRKALILDIGVCIMEGK